VTLTNAEHGTRVGGSRGVLLSAEALTFGYRADAPIITNWSAEFRAGEVVALTGPSGSGKSTLLYLLGLMLTPQSGQIRLLGRSATGLRDHERARLRAFSFGFVFQDAALDSTRTVLDNVIETALYRSQDRQSAVVRALELMERFGVALRADAKPGQVSGGQAQRIALCRALLGAPQVLLADEPTGNLDISSSAVVIDALHEQAATGSTVIVVTHDPTVVSRCDRSIEL